MNSSYKYQYDLVSRAILNFPEKINTEILEKWDSIFVDMKASYIQRICESFMQTVPYFFTKADSYESRFLDLPMGSFCLICDNVTETNFVSFSASAAVLDYNNAKKANPATAELHFLKDDIESQYTQEFVKLYNKALRYGDPSLTKKRNKNDWGLGLPEHTIMTLLNDLCEAIVKNNLCDTQLSKNTTMLTL